MALSIFCLPLMRFSILILFSRKQDEIRTLLKFIDINTYNSRLLYSKNTAYCLPRTVFLLPWVQDCRMFVLLSALRHRMTWSTYSKLTIRSNGHQLGKIWHFKIKETVNSLHFVWIVETYPRKLLIHFKDILNGMNGVHLRKWTPNLTSMDVLGLITACAVVCKFFLPSFLPSFPSFLPSFLPYSFFLS